MAQIILDSNNNLIQGDFDNATLNNRTKLQTTTTNATTNVYVVPNGSSTSAGVSVANNSNLTNASKIVMATNGSTDTQIISGVNGSGTYLPLSFYTNNAQSMIIDTANNVGIGTSSPVASYRLSIYDQTNGATNISGLALIEPGSATSYSYFKTTSQASADTRTIIGNGAASRAFAFETGGTERMRIDSVGALLVNVTANLGNSATKMNVAFDQSLGPGFVIKNNSGSYNTNASIAFINASNGNAGYIILTNATTTAYVTTSDYRLKENIAPMTGALDKVLQLKPVTYKWKVDGSDGQGFIAHELQAVVPDAVSGEKDAVETYTDEEGNEQTRIKPQGVDTSFLVATLTAAIQEQQTIINDLKSRIEALESK